jgi:hypothetical protein
METKNLNADFCVVGGGMAGVCAAVSAARQGAKVILVQNRSVLGGNASSEIRQHIGGAGFSGHYPDAREGGIVGDLWTQIRRQSYGNNLNDYAESSVIFWDACRREPNLRLFLSTPITEVEKDGRRITAISGVQMTTGIRYRFVADHFADCTGDAHVAHISGAAYRTGQEARAEFNESLAPEQPAQHTMGNTILFQAEKLNQPVPPPKFDWIEDLRQKKIWWTLHPPRAPMEFGSWVFEYGGELDTIADAERIHAELLKILYSAWADLKQRPECGMQNYRLSFISSLPGKRESRRVIGDYTLTQNDIVETRRFPDDVAYAGWSLDLHNPEGFWGKERGTTFFFFPEIHSIPLRCLYARDLDNLWLAGRDISVTHVALGGCRLMASCGIAGEAVGIAASFAHRRGHSARAAAQQDISEIQQEILKQGGFIPCVRNEDPADLARRATVTGSGEAVLDPGAPTQWDAIGAGVGIAFPVTAGGIDRLRLQVKNPTDRPITLHGVLQPIMTMRDFHPTRVLAEASAIALPCNSEVGLQFNATGLAADLYMVHLFASDPALLLGQTTRRVTGVHVADYRPEGDQDNWGQQLGMPNPAVWKRRFNPSRGKDNDVFHPTPCFRLLPESRPYAPANVVNGINRPTRLANIWCSDPAADLPQTLTLCWDAPVTLSEVRIIFDADMDLAMGAVEIPTTLAADYELVAESRTLADVTGNTERLCVHRFPATRVESLSLHIRRMHNQARQVRVCEIRCY